MARSSYKKLLDEAVAAGNARDYPAAIDILTRVLSETDTIPEAWLYLGRARHASGDPDRAMAAFRRYLAIKPSDPSGWFHAGRSYMGLGLARHAGQCFRKTLELGRDNAETWALLGLSELKLRRSGKAVECLEKAVTLAPGDARVFRGYANALYVHAIRLQARGEDDLAAQMLDFVVKNGGDGTSARLYRARALRSLGRLAEAAGELKAALALAPDDVSIAAQAAALSLASGRPDEAFGIIERAGAELPLPRDAPWTEELMDKWRAALALSRGDMKAALAAAHVCIKRGDKDPAIRAIAAQANYELGRYDRAANHYALACEADPSSVDFRLGLALSLWEAGDEEGAERAARAAASRGARPEDADYVLALCDARKGAAPNTLLPRLQVLLRARPGDSRLMFALAECQYRLGMPELADGWFTDVLSVQPDHEMALLYRISVAESIGREQDVIQRYADYLGNYPDNHAIRKDYVSRLMASGLWAEAATAIEEGYAYGVAGRSADGALALCYRNAGRFREAAAQYRTLLRAEPRNVEFLLGLAWCLEKAGSRAVAAELLEKGAAFLRKEAAPYLALAFLRDRAKQAEKAAEAFMKASELAPADPRPLRGLERLYRKAGVAELAERFANQAAGLERPRSRSKPVG
ncbi:MAG: tetratricopeptide repeat protein [Spirochaetia bacterium]|nr:tetratricopeptide repeat protein [Spirochaetia bacterium]